MSKHYSAVSIVDDDDNGGGFDPRAPLPPGGVSVTIPIHSPSNSNTATTTDSDHPSLELTNIHATLTPTDEQNSARSSITGDESTALVDPRQTTSDQTNETSSSSSSSAGTAGLVILDHDPPGPDEITVTLMKLGGNGLGNIQLNIPNVCTVAGLIRRVYSNELREGKRVRLVSMGRMLKDDEVLASVGVRSGQILHVLLTTPPPPDDGTSTLNGADSSTMPIAPPVANGMPPLMQGPAYFDDYPGNAQLYSDRQLAMMQQAQLSEEARYHQQRLGTNTDFVIGVMLGFILGFVSLICLVNVASSRKQRLGILVGVALNILLGLRQMANEAREANSQPGPTTVKAPQTTPSPVGNSR